MAGFIVVDALEGVMANRIGDLFEQEGTQRAVERDFQHGNDRAEHFQRHLVGLGIEPVDDQTQIDIGQRDLVFFEHAPATHQRHLGVGVALFLGMEIGIHLLENGVFGLACHGREAARADMLDPHQIGHEGLELGPLFVGDQFGAGGIPVDVGQRPLAGLDLGQHFFQIDVHENLLSARVIRKRTHGPCPMRRWRQND